MGYSAFASFYDALTENVDYKAIAEYYDRLNSKFKGRKEILLDLACGTGSLSVLFSEMGYDVIGVDSSPEMLSIAVSKNHDNIEYLCQDMTELDLYGTIQGAVCSLDSINHLESKGDILKAFRKVSLFSESGSLFMFDVNTPYKHEHILSDNAFVYETEKVYCVWQNEYAGEGKTDITLDFFTENKSGLYERESDYFSEIACPEEELRAMLEEAGFEVCAVYEYLTEDMPRPESDKLTFVARKK